MSKPVARLTRLETMARERLVRVVYSRQLLRGGHCRLRGQPIVLIGSQLGAEEKAELLEQGLLRLFPELEAQLGAPEQSKPPTAAADTRIPGRGEPRQG
jgi:hypothetical protein